MYKVQGKIKNTEYYRFEFWKDRWMYLIVFLVPTLLAIFPIDSLSMQPFFSDMSEQEVLLTQWIIYFLVGVITLTAFLFVSAAIQKRSWLEMREYLFSNEKIMIRSQAGERYVQWSEVVRIVEKETVLIIQLTNKGYIFIPARFFEHTAQKQEVTRYIKNRMRGE